MLSGRMFNSMVCNGEIKSKYVVNVNISEENDLLMKEIQRLKADLQTAVEALEYYDQVHRLNWTIDFNDLPVIAHEALEKIKGK